MDNMKREYSFALVDDSLKDLDTLEAKIQSYANKKGLSIKIEKINNPTFFLSKYRSIYDALFLDVEMPMLSGIDLAKEIRKKDNTTKIIFCTNYDQYAINGYEVQATDYLLKPINDTELEMTLDGLIEELNNLNLETIQIGKYRIPLSSIIYIESNKHTISFHTDEGCFTTLDSLKRILSIVPSSSFFQISNFIIINRSSISFIGKDFVVCKGNKLYISRRKKASFLAWINKEY